MKQHLWLIMVKMSLKTSVLILAGFLVCQSVIFLNGGSASAFEDGSWANPAVYDPSVFPDTKLKSSPVTSLSAKDPKKQYSVTMKKYLKQTLDTSFRDPQKKSHKPMKKKSPIVSKEKPSGYVSRIAIEPVDFRRTKRSQPQHDHNQDKNVTTIAKKPVDQKELGDKYKSNYRHKKVSRKTSHLSLENKSKLSTKKPIRNGTKTEEKIKIMTTKRPMKESSTTTKNPPTTAKPTSLPAPIETAESVLIKLNKSSIPTITKYSYTNKDIIKTISQENSTTESTRRFECGKVPMFNQKMDSKTEKLVNSTNAKRGEWPWVVQIHRCRKGSSRSCVTCTGTLLNENWLITAGHCLSGFQNGSHTFTATFDIAGTSLNDSKGGSSLKHRRIDKTILHPEYEEMDNDLALLKLKRAVKFSALVQPICLLPPTRNLLQYSKQRECFMLGYNPKKNSKLDSSSRRLHGLKIQIEEPSRCNTDVLHETTMRIGTVCVSSAISNSTNLACETDSGGPNLCLDQNLNEWQLFGVTSYALSSQCDDPHTVNSVSVDLSNYRSWIRSVISG